VAILGQLSSLHACEKLPTRGTPNTFHNVVRVTHASPSTLILKPRAPESEDSRLVPYDPETARDPRTPIPSSSQQYPKSAHLAPLCCMDDGETLSRMPSLAGWAVQEAAAAATELELDAEGVAAPVPAEEPEGAEPEPRLKGPDDEGHDSNKSLGADADAPAPPPSDEATAAAAAAAAGAGAGAGPSTVTGPPPIRTTSAAAAELDEADTGSARSAGTDGRSKAEVAHNFLQHSKPPFLRSPAVSAQEAPHARLASLPVQIIWLSSRRTNVARRTMR